VSGRAIRGALCASAVALALVPLSGDRFWVQFTARTMIACIFAMSLDLLVGYAGIVSFAHAAFFGLGAYLLAGLANGAGLANPLATLPLALAGTALLALVIGFLSVRTSGVYLVMITLAFTQMLYYLFGEAPGLGGSDGLYLAQRPRFPASGRALLDLGDGTTVYLVIWAALVAVYLLLSRAVRAPFGRVLAGIRSNEPRMRTLGYRTRRYKIAAFVAAGALAGLAGYLDATLYGFVNPAIFGWRQSGLVLVTVLLGGKGTLYGPALGAVVLGLLEHFGATWTAYWNALIGAVAIATVLALPGGLAGLVRGSRG
jgi:branched-chain amino acid transport system permease protein